MKDFVLFAPMKIQSKRGIYFLYFLGGNTVGLQKQERHFTLFGGVIKNNFDGIYIQMSTTYFSLQDVTMENNVYVIYSEMSTRYFNLKNVKVKYNTYGIYSYSPNISLNNCLITGGSTAAINMHADSHKTLSVTDSKIYNCPLVVNFNNYRTNAVAVFHRCTLVGNNRIVNEYWYSSYYFSLNVSECNISRTRDDGFFVDLADQSAVKLSFNNNNFFKNEHTVFRIKWRSFNNRRSTIRMEENVFVNNFLSSGDALIDFSEKRTGVFTAGIHKNTFTENKCSFLIKVDSRSNRLGTAISFSNNILENNEGIPSNSQEYVEADVNSYSLGLLGCISNQYDIQHNVFDNELMDKELFLGRTCSSNYLSKNVYINATNNYWGTLSTKNLRNRIFHFANWNDRPTVKYLPAVTSRNFSDFITSEAILNQSQIGGYVSSSLRLSTTYSPYVVNNDLTISENVTLEIEAGVQIYFKPKIGLLVLGNIIAHGTTREKIKLCSLKRKCKHERRMIRLTSGDREYRGNLEIFVGGRWLAACPYYFTSSDGSVACRQLGYGRYINHKTRYYRNSAPQHKISFGCHGNETSLLDCNKQTVNYCGSVYYEVYLECEGDYRWGNVRIVPPQKVNASYYYHQNEQSSLGNIIIYGAGCLHDEDVSSLQIIERSPSITNIHIVESNGIEIIGQKHIMELEHINIENSLKFPAIVIMGNKGSISISHATIMGGNQHGIAIAPIKNMTFFQPYLGQHDLCDPVQRIVVNGESYVFLNQRNNVRDIFCAVEIQSPNNTIINFRLLSWVQNSYSLKIYRDGRSSLVAQLDDGNIRQYLDKDVVISSNSLTIEAEISTLRGFLAEIAVIGQTGKKS